MSHELGVEEVEFLPVLITEYIDGLRLDKAISEYGFSADKVADCLRRIAQALDFLHVRHEYMHVDVKAANVLVRKETHEPVLIDFALAKNLNFQEVDRNEVTKLLGDWGLFPQLDEGHPLKRIKEGHPATRESIRAEAFPYLDLFQFGKLLEALQTTCAERLEAREMGYLADLTVRLTNWDTLHEWTPGQLADRISRLSPERATPFGIEELTVPGAAERTIILPLAGGVPVTTIVQRVINTRSFRRLSLINQLSLLGLVYPAADYKRSVHVLYSYELYASTSGPPVFVTRIPLPLRSEHGKADASCQPAA